MMTNLFSSFDPATWVFSMNWLSSPMILIMMPPMFWMIPSRWTIMWVKVASSLHSEFKILIQSFKGSTILPLSIFFLILTNNFLGLFPYIFTCSSHMSFSLVLSLPMWLSFMIFSWVKNTIHMLAHLVPQGAPSALLPFLVLVETISNIIRPGTLAIRLTANMIAGHLLLTLMGNAGSSMSIIPLFALVTAQTLLLVLETAVSMIQAYVFSILVTLYSSETS
uniref:ATP synthase subunit a n=1 Tax=Curculionoidea sp. 28 KM-2017 TaxID=2219412 RepID=A0A346RJ67_9CUCU|nr:ATP synthase F0 subunit 6 [Curculionoidea sp. 28 KM-2017]